MLQISSEYGTRGILFYQESWIRIIMSELAMFATINKVKRLKKMLGHWRTAYLRSNNLIANYCSENLCISRAQGKSKCIRV